MPKQQTTKKKRVAVFIDGSNLYFKLKTLIPTKTDLIHYRYRDLVAGLLEKDEQLVHISYYIGVVRENKKPKQLAKAEELVKNQQRLFEELRKQKIEVVRGYLLERDGKFFEKGVDVRLAVDIATMAAEKKYDIGLIISSDTDLIPAMQKAQNYKRKLTYVGFEHQPSFALIRHADKSKLISQKHAEKYRAKSLVVKRFDDVK